ncbi:unnamed protein product, partial [marine sediment metagenome]
TTYCISRVLVKMNIHKIREKSGFKVPLFSFFLSDVKKKGSYNIRK